MTAVKPVHPYGGVLRSIALLAGLLLLADSVSQLIQAAGGLERNRFGRDHGFAPGILSVAWSRRKPARFRDHAPAGTTAMANTQSDEKRRAPC